MNLKLETISQLRNLANMFVLANTQSSLVVLLHGDLGVGKTTFVQFVLGFLGCNDSVKSPTYNILNEYNVNGKVIYHFDLYRIDRKADLDQIGLNDCIFQENSLSFIEWGCGKELSADIVVELSYSGQESQSIDEFNFLGLQSARNACFRPLSPVGNIVLNCLYGFISGKFA